MLEILATVILLHLQPGLAQAARVANSRDRASILESVLNHRLYWMGDSTQFDGCTFSAMQISESEASSLSRGIRRVISSRACGEQQPGSSIRVASVQTLDSVATVMLTITRGEYRYREEYLLAKRPRFGVWWIRSVKHDRMIQTKLSGSGA